jgi:hypothetical protein
MDSLFSGFVSTILKIKYGSIYLYVVLSVV